MSFPKPSPIVLGTLITFFVFWVVTATAVKFSPGLSAVISHLPLAFEPVFSSGEVWRVLTYALMHDTGSMMHLLMNGLMLWWFGSELEKRWGKGRFILFMALCALSGGAFFLAGSALGIVSATYVIGASAITEGVIVAWALIYRHRTILLFFVLPIRAIHMVWFAIGFACLEAISTSSVSAAAHFGGIAMGLILTLGLFRGNKWRLFWDKLLVTLKMRKKPNLYVVPGPDKYNVN